MCNTSKAQVTKTEKLVPGPTNLDLETKSAVLKNKIAKTMKVRHNVDNWVGLILQNIIVYNYKQPCTEKK